MKSLNKQKVEHNIQKNIHEELYRLKCVNIFSKVEYNSGELKVCLFTKEQGENNGWIHTWDDFFHEELYTRHIQELLTLLYEVAIYENNVIYKYMHRLNPLFLK